MNTNLEKAIETNYIEAFIRKGYKCGYGNTAE
jgi:hypothetical protein